MRCIAELGGSEVFGNGLVHHCGVGERRHVSDACEEMEGRAGQSIVKTLEGAAFGERRL